MPEVTPTNVVINTIQAVAAIPQAAEAIAGFPGIAVLAAGTDGTDGPTDAAGGLVDGDTARRATEAGLALRGCLDESDSYRWLEAAGGLLRTGPTHTNVNDLVLLVRTSTR